MEYLARFAHLKNKPDYKAGDIITRGDIIGTMGNTGQSTRAHVHMDLTQYLSILDLPTKMYRLADVPNHIIDLPALMQQYHYFIDNELFGCKVKITTSFGDPTYCLPEWKFHPAFDLVPSNKLKTAIKWNRSMNAIVHMVGNDPGYGYYIILRFEA